MTRGRKICDKLKAVRQSIAEENGIPMEVEECTHTGECRGTCPRCEAEVRYLERALSMRLRVGEAATVAGVALTLAACGGQSTRVAVASSDTLSSTSLCVDSMVDTTLPPPNDMMWMQTESTVGFVAVEHEEGDTLPPFPIAESPLLNDTIEDGDVEGDMPADALMGMIEETAPEYPGGEEALYDFLRENIIYPDEAKRLGIEGKVYVMFVIEEDGAVADARLLRDIGGGCGEEALRVVRMMPRWTPGRMQDKVVRTQYALPVRFTLPQVDAE